MRKVESMIEKKKARANKHVAKKVLTTKIGRGPRKNFPSRYKENMGIQIPSGYPKKGGILIDPNTYPLQRDLDQQFPSFS